MASPNAVFAGISEANFTENIAIYAWSIYDIANDEYLYNTTRGLIIDTPNFSTGQNGPQAVATNGEPCGSAPFLQEQAGGLANTRTMGAWKNVGNGGQLSTPPGRFGHLGCVKVDDYYLENPNGEDGFDGTNFVQNFTDGLWQYDLSNSARALTPGVPKPDSDTYNVIMPSTPEMGAATAQTGRRIHWDVAVGSLNSLLIKLQQRGIGKITTLYGGTIANGMGDEQTATVWLSMGYGIMKAGTPAFASFS